MGDVLGGGGIPTLVPFKTFGTYKPIGKVGIKPNIDINLVQIKLILTILGVIKMCTFFGFGLTWLYSLHSQIGIF